MQALRCRFNKRNRFKDIEVVMDLSENLKSGTSTRSGPEKRRPPRRLKWLAGAMPTRKPELVTMCNDWKVPLPEQPSDMRVINLQDALWAHDAKLTKDTIDPKSLVKSWNARKITFGKKRHGRTYEAVCEQDPDYCEWIFTATHVNEAMKQLMLYIEMREKAKRTPKEPEECPRSRPPRSRARTSTNLCMAARGRWDEMR